LASRTNRLENDYALVDIEAPQIEGSQDPEVRHGKTGTRTHPVALKKLA